MKNDRKEILDALHMGIELSLKPIMENTLQGLHCTTSDRAQILVHFLLTSYTAHIPECENTIFEKRGKVPLHAATVS